MTQIFAAPTLEGAKQAAAECFGVPVSAITFTVLEEPKRSLFGGLFGKKEAEYRVQAVYEPQAASEDTVVPAENTAAPAAPAEEAVADTKVPAAEAASPAEEESKRSKPEWEDIPEDVRQEKTELALEYLKQVLAVLAPNVTCTAKHENGISITLEGDDAGVLIGRRGDTLDALQYLTSMVANRGDKPFVRLTIDTCGYRSKRRTALQELAQRIARGVLRTGKPVALEPMNPYERRIIHATVTDIEGVSSHSSGEEPYRKVIITSDSASARREERGGRGGRDRREHGGKGGDRRDNRRRDRSERRPSEGPRKLDLSTSFEKDYKRPKPEDSLNAGVYGKIDF